MLLMISCSGGPDQKKKSIKIYEECYKVSENMFKNIPAKDFEKLTVGELCDSDTSFYEGKKDETCIRACGEAFYFYKQRR